jgi:hypothetical protein
MNSEAARDFAQPFTTRREEAAQQPALAQFLDSRPPAFCAAAKPLDDAPQLRLCKRSRAVATHRASLRRHWTQSLDTGSGRRDLSRGAKSLPQRRTTSSSDQPWAVSGSRRTSTCKWLSSTENPPTATAKIPESSCSRLSIHCLRFIGTSPSRNARRTQRVMQSSPPSADLRLRRIFDDTNEKTGTYRISTVVTAPES